MGKLKNLTKIQEPTVRINFNWSDDLEKPDQPRNPFSLIMSNRGDHAMRALRRYSSSLLKK
jgi:hypothetical protein